MSKSNDLSNEKIQKTALSDEELNDLTVTPSNNNILKATLSKSSAKYDVEQASVKMDRLEQVKSNVTIASIIDLPDPQSTFYDDIPDGGYGWYVAISGFLINFVMFGAGAIWGVFSNAFATGVLEGKATTMQLMGVGSIINVFLNLFSPVSALLSRFGVRCIMFLGSTIMSLGLILAGFSTEVWHVYLTQGMLFGLGCSLVYMSIVAVIPQWFTTRRGTAMGISSAGSGFGGLALSPMASSLIDKYGIGWAYRIIGLMAFGVCCIGTALIRTRLPPGQENKPVRSPIKLSTLKDSNFILMLFGVVIALSGYLVPLYYIPKYCSSQGISTTDSSTIVGVLCAMNALGRLILGYFADRIGRLNMFMIASTCAGLFCMLLWPFAKTYGTMMAFAVVFGFTCGIYYALAAPITATVVGQDDIASGLSLLFIFSSLAAVCPPAASAIQNITPNEGYIGVQMFSGSVYLCGSLICMILKIKMTGSAFSRL
ncbi:MFS general substrate transporter [Backusella circina FSU 941]|nr:MFS general substrate transporter [Backusella circina FSU 941]